MRLVRRLTANAHSNIALLLLAVEFRLVGGNRNFRFADNTPGMWKVIGHFYVQRDYSVRMGIGKGRVLPGYFVDAVREGASR